MIFLFSILSRSNSIIIAFSQVMREHFAQREASTMKREREEREHIQK